MITSEHVNIYMFISEERAHREDVYTNVSTGKMLIDQHVNTYKMITSEQVEI
jgi:hypothetical protein